MFINKERAHRHKEANLQQAIEQTEAKAIDWLNQLLQHWTWIFNMTTAREQLLRELDQTPDFVVQEVLDFLLFIKLRLGQKIGEEAIAAPQESPTLPPFLQFVEEISAQIPREEWEKLPKDLARNLDHYLYGAPKNEE